MKCCAHRGRSTALGVVVLVGLAFIECSADESAPARRNDAGADVDAAGAGAGGGGDGGAKSSGGRASTGGVAEMGGKPGAGGMTNAGGKSGAGAMTSTGGGTSIGGMTSTGGTTSDAGMPTAATFPLKRGPAGSRYLVGQNDVPFFWSGDTAWSLIAELDDADASAYLDDRRDKAFNVVLVNLIEHKFASKAPADSAGDAPFTGAPFATPNEAYFAHADAVIEAAAARNIVVLLDVLYLGYGCGDEGWCAEVQAASTADLTAWGEYVGNRYASRPNIVYVIGGDTDPTPVKAKMTAFVGGISAKDSSHLFTAHNAPETFAVSPWSGATWLGINDVYSYSNTLYQEAKTAYDLSPTKPFFEIESAYENEHGSTPQSLRAQAYWSVLGGAMGHTFGNCPIWHFGSSMSWCGTNDWKGNLGHPASLSMMHLANLMRSRPWYDLSPDWDHTVVTAGYGTWGSADYATAARATDGATSIAYLPSSRVVTVDLGKVASAMADAWWYDPSKGAATKIGTYPTTGMRQFTPPAAGDWVLVVDAASTGFGPPGMVQ